MEREVITIELNQNEIVIAPFLVSQDQFSKRIGVNRFLEQLTGLPFGELQIVRTDLGRPEFGEPKFDIDFNLSYSGRLNGSAHQVCLMAACRCGRIGIDVERLDRAMELEEPMRPVFSPDEVQWVDSIDGVREKQDRFFAIWTRKESYLKATGVGLSIDARGISYAVEANPLEWLAPNFLTDEIQNQTGWATLDLQPMLKHQLVLDHSQLASAEFAAALTTNLSDPTVNVLPLQVLC